MALTIIKFYCSKLFLDRLCYNLRNNQLLFLDILVIPPLSLFFFPGIDDIAKLFIDVLFLFLCPRVNRLRF